MDGFAGGRVLLRLLVIHDEITARRLLLLLLLAIQIARTRFQDALLGLLDGLGGERLLGGDTPLVLQLQTHGLVRLIALTVERWSDRFSLYVI